nr:hypothetical protein [Actinomycetota bacterium]
MTMTRRQFLGAAGATLLAPIAGRVGPAFGQAPVDPASAARNRLVVIFLDGGNDGLNTVIPRADVAGSARYSVYRRARPKLGYQPGDSLLLDRGGDAAHALGLNKRLTTLHRFYRDGRVAIVQGVDYPKHNYSHFTSADVWHSGEPARAADTGWLGRHLDRVGTSEGELRGVGIGYKIPLMLNSQGGGGAAIASIGAMKFDDGTGDLARARHAAMMRF